MRAVLRLLRANLWERPLRTALTALATACATCLVVWVVSAYASAMNALDLYATRALGHYTLVVDPVSHALDRSVPPEALAMLRAEPQVAVADPMWAELVTLAPGTGGDLRRAEECIALGADAATPPFALARGRWIAADESDALEVALSAPFAAALGVDVGAQVSVPGTSGTTPLLTVVGIVTAPPEPITGVPMGSRALPSPSVAGAFMSLRDLRALTRREPRTTFVGVRLTPEADVHALRHAWGPRLSALAQPVQVMHDGDLEESMSEAAKSGQLGLQA